MSMHWRKFIEEQKTTEDKLLVAMDIIKSMMPTDATLSAMQIAFGMTKTEANVLAHMYKAAGGFVDKERLESVVTDFGYNPEEERDAYSLLKSRMSHVRRKLRESGIPDAIETVWGSGYRLTTKGVDSIEQSIRSVEVHRETFEYHSWPEDSTRPERHGEPFTKEEDEDLMRMISNGDHWDTIAYELSRTTKAVYCRHQKIKGKVNG